MRGWDYGVYLQSKPTHTNTMKNGNTPINAVFDEFGHITGESCSETGHVDFYGLTKREYFAGLALQGYLSSFAGISCSMNEEHVVRQSVDFADALLAELEKPTDK